MLLRRIASAVTRQDWSIVGIELVILIVGIFIGLQVDDWNNDRKNRSDEQQYIQRLHADVMLADDLTRRVRDRLLDRLQAIKTAGDVIFDRIDRDEFEDGECIAISASSFITIDAPRLATFDELVGTGRLEIFRDSSLLGALITLEQYRAALGTLVMNQSADNAVVFLPTAYPELIEVSSFTQVDTGEIRVSADCDVETMRMNRSFLNQFAFNADTYDVFIRDGLAPWNKQFTKVHKILDAALGTEHTD